MNYGTNSAYNYCVHSAEGILIAVPRFGAEIAPCFEAAVCFETYIVRKGRAVHTDSLTCGSESPVERVRLLREAGVHALICDGIQTFYRDMLKSEGIEVIDHVSGNIKEAAASHISDLSARGKALEEKRGNNTDATPPLPELIDWARGYFSDNGYEVVEGNQFASFPVDLVAAVNCPLCGMPVKVAICCGGHTYLAEKEIREFYHVSGENFEAKVYVHTFSPGVEKICAEFGIELLDPAQKESEANRLGARKSFPALSKPIKGHERAFLETEDRGQRTEDG